MRRLALLLFVFFIGWQNLYSKGKKDLIDQDKLPLSLVDLIDIALQRNNNLKVSYLSVDMGSDDVEIARSAFYPTVTASGNYGYQRSGGRTEDSDSVSLNAGYTVFAFGRNKNALEQTKYRLNQLNYENNDTIQNLMYNVSMSYYEVLRLIAQRNSLIESEKSSMETFKAASLKHKLGIAVLADKLSAKASNSRDKLSLTQINNSIRNSKSELNLLLNFDSRYNLFIEEPEVKVTKIKINFDKLLDVAYKNRNDLKIKLEERKILEKTILNLQVDKLPTIEASGALRRGRDGSSAEYRGASVSLGVSVPLFSGFNSTNQIKKAKNNLKRLDVEIEELKNTISGEVLVAYNNLVTAEQSFHIAAETLESEVAHAKLMWGMYKNGKSSILEVLEANNNLQNARFQLITTKYDWLDNRITLLKVIGKMTIENINNVEGI
jgi:outer membrane protein